ncbi:MAG: type I restriction endonuclease subunit M, partial [Bacteroidota bacterium]
EDTPLLDAYDLYQHLMDYWAVTMQDDVYLIAQDGWTTSAGPRTLIPRKGEKLMETPDLVVGRVKYAMDLVPPDLIVARYFADEKRAVEALEADAEAAGAALDGFIEEHSGEDGLLEDARADSGKVTKASVMARRVDLGPDDAEEHAALRQVLKLMKQESAAKKKAKEAQKALDTKVFARYKTLTEAEIKTLVVDDKWLHHVETEVDSELYSVLRDMHSWLADSAERYSIPLPRLVEMAEERSSRVDLHLQSLGLTWA